MIKNTFKSTPDYIALCLYKDNAAVMGSAVGRYFADHNTGRCDFHQGARAHSDEGRNA